MAKIIHYTGRGYTQSNNEYVTVNDDDMPALINQCIVTIARLAELSASSEGAKVMLSRNKELYGKRGKTEIAPGRENTVLSVIGGVINNYMTKEDRFKNDLSLGQLPYIEHALNETCEWCGFDPIVFQNQVVSFK